MIHVAHAICVHECLIFGDSRGNADFLRSPVEIDTNRVRWKDHKRTHTCVIVIQALAVRVAPCRGAKRKQAWTITPITSNRKRCLHDNVEALAKSMECFYTRQVIHEPECVAADVELSTLKPWPLLDAGAHKPPFEAFVAPFTFRRVDCLLITVTL